MARKIYDIFPPNFRSEMKPSSECQKHDPIFSSRPAAGRLVKWSLLVISAILAIFVLGYFFFLKVDIDIWPETQLVEYSGSIEARSDHLHYDIETGVIPGKLFVVEKEESRTFLASGKEMDERRAEGTLRVYNNHSGLPQTLVTNTRFVSAGGKLFRSTKSVLIPGKSGSEPGYADVVVRAVEPGLDYNINEVTKFSIPGLQGTPMYANIYAENREPITGGFIGELPVITATDIETAREILLLSLTESAKKEMMENAPDFVFNEEMMDINVITEFVRPEVGEKYESFDYLLKIEVRSFAFKRSDIEDFLKDILLSQLKEENVNLMFAGKEIWSESLTFDYEADLRGMDDGSISLKIDASAIAYPVIREDLIKNEIVGMTIDEARIALADYDRIDRVEITPRPSWLKRIPSSDKIRIEIRFDER